MNSIGFLILFILAFIGQTAINPIIEVFGVSPDFILIFVVFVALRYGAVAGVVWGFAAGLVEDVYGPLEWLGAAALSKCVVGWLVGQLEEKFLNLDLITKVAVLGIAFFVCDALFGLTVGMNKEDISKLFLSKSLPEGVYTLVIGTIAFHFLYSRPHNRHAS